MDYLVHFNKYHDPDNGQFTSGPKSASMMTDKELQYKIKRRKNELAYEQLYPSRGQQISNTGSDITRTAQSLQNVRLPKKKGPKADLSQYSDQELQRIINRARNEQEYDRLFNPERESEGQKFVNGLATFLTIAGGAVTVVGGGLAIYDRIKGKAAKNNTTPLGLPG